MEVNSDFILFEIFPRLSLRTLRKCRLLSTEFNRLSYDSTFMHLYCQNTKTAAGYFIQSLKRNHYYSTFMSIDTPNLDSQSELRLDFLAEPVEILAVHQGLMLCYGRFSSLCYICKPSTRQWEIIPKPKFIGISGKTGLLVSQSEPLRFKILRVSEDKIFNNYKHYQCEVFDSEIWDWKQLDDLKLYYEELFESKSAMTTYCNLHWVTSRKNLLSFYGDEESWNLISLPKSFCHEDHSVKLAEYEGKLALIVMRSEIGFVELWVMKDYYGEKLWVKKHMMDLTVLNREIGHSSLDSFYNGDILFMKGLFNAIFYNFKTDQFDYLELQLQNKYPESAFFIQTDYEPINLKQPRKKLCLREIGEETRMEQLYPC